MRKVTQHITVIQPRHRNLAHYHLQERRERREDALVLAIEAETGGGGEVAALHDAGGDEDVGVVLVDDFEAGGAFEVA